ncbi:MAG: hypothetical protein OXI46_11280 [Gemmatimonadota bacterium]|nr:hypothetical protein [Gemmatimonadota bacterium]
MTKRIFLASTALVAAASIATGLLPDPSAAMEFGGYWAGGATLSRERASELYAAALQHIAGDYLDTVANQDTRALLDALEADGTTLPAGQGTLDPTDIGRFQALGIQAAAGDGQIAVWVVEGELRHNTNGVDIELAAQRLRLGMVGRIRGNRFLRDGTDAAAISATLAAVLPERAVGIVLPVRSPADVLAEDLDATAHRRRPCPAGQYGFGIREQRSFIRRVTGTGAATLEWTSPWREIGRSCATESTQDVVSAKQCPAPEPGWELYRFEQRIERDPEDDYGFRIWPGDLAAALNEEPPVASRIHDTCGIDGKRLESVQRQEIGTRARACSAVYTPSSPPTPAYSGEVQEERTIDVVETWFVGFKSDGIERRYFGPWREVSNNCSRDMSRSVTRRRVRSCPSSYPRGDSQEQDTGTERYREFPGAPEQILGVTWDDNWRLASTSCHRTWSTAGSPEYSTSGCTRYRRSVTHYYAAWESTGGRAQLQRTSRGPSVATGIIPGCGDPPDSPNPRNSRDSTGDSDRGGNGDSGRNYTSGIDTDGDGDIDMSITEARADPSVEVTEENIITKPDDELGTDDFRNDGDDRDDDDSGGSEPCFLTTAIVELRGEADHGPTLSTLREFRDAWLAATPEGRQLIDEYYVLAPRIAAAIPKGHADWAWIADRVDASRAAILAGENAAALGIYHAMVRTLQARWL